MLASFRRNPQGYAGLMIRMHRFLWVWCYLFTGGWTFVVGQEYLVADRESNRVVRFSAVDGSLIAPLVDDDLATNGGLFMPSAMAYGFENDLFVTSIDASSGDGRVLRYDAATGDFLGIFAAGLLGPAGLSFHQPSNTLLVGSLGAGLGDSNVIYRFSSDGTPLPPVTDGPISGRTDMAVGPQGELYVSSFAEEPFFNGSVLKFDYVSGTDTFALDGTFAADPRLVGANGLTFDGAGDLYVAGLLGQSVLKFDIEENTTVGSPWLANVPYPSGLVVGIDGQLLVTSLGNNNPSDPIYGNNLFPGAVFKHDPITGAVQGGGPFLSVSGGFQPTAILLRRRFISGDFNGDGMYNCTDVDALVVEVAAQSNSHAFDLTDDGLVNGDDLAAWLAEAGAANLASGRPYLPGDANLDGSVDGSDFGTWNMNKFTIDPSWCSGDFSADGSIDGSDFSIWNTHKFTSSNAAATVPEPTAAARLVAALSLLGAWYLRRR